MPIAITCPECSVSYKVPDNVAGKKIRCPKCSKAVIRVPSEDSATAANTADAAVAARTSAGVIAATKTSVEQSAPQWQIKTEGGDVYGPVDKSELDQWVAEGRVSAQSHLLQSGAQQWQWATDIYPELNSSQPNPSASVATTSALAGTAEATANNQAFQSPVVSSGQPYQHQYVQPRPQNTRVVSNQKSKIVAGLLGLFLGGYGVHNFYLGNTGTAVAQLLLTLTCFGAIISGPWALIESIMILTGSIDRDAQGRPLAD